ncbi:MAG: lipid-A-disaccharide synthase [Verrucomicrobiota bacterium]
MRFYLLAGEASGDARGAEVMRALTVEAATRGETVEFLGAGGPEMRALAPAIQDWSGEAVVGLWDVLKKYGYFRRQLYAMRDEIAALKPDAVVLIDYPGFNLRLAKALRQRDPKQRIIHYISPQVWAWNRRRIPEMARTLDLMLCLFPFEKELYEESGLKTVFVGHPLLDSLAVKRITAPRDSKLVGLFPGSRMKEVTRIFPVMLKTAAEMRKALPELRFEAAAASESLGAVMRAMAGGSEVRIRVGNSHELMQQAGSGMLASGTATLEATYFELPYVLLYKVAPLTWQIGKRLVKVPFLGIANILAGREIVREYLQEAAEPVAIADELLGMLNYPEKCREQVAEFREVIAGLGAGGAAARAARAIYDEVKPPVGRA